MAKKDDGELLKRLCCFRAILSDPIHQNIQQTLPNHFNFPFLQSKIIKENMRLPWQTEQSMPLRHQISQEEGKNSEERLLSPSSSHREVEVAPLKSSKSKHLWIFTILNTLMLLGTLTLLTFQSITPYHHAPAPQKPALKQFSHSCASNPAPQHQSTR